MSENKKEDKPLYLGLIARLVSIRGPSTEEGTVVVSDFELHDPMGQNRGMFNLPYNIEIMGNLGDAFRCTIKLEKITVEEYIASRTGASLIKSDTKPLGCV